MKRLLCVLVLAGAPLLRAQDSDPVGSGIDYNQIFARQSAGSKRPELDPKRIINESNSFLKEKEPEMTAEEYALYEKVMSMLATNPAFAIRLLEAMVDEKEKPSPAFEFILGNAYYSAGEIEQSEAHYRAAVERFPTFLRAWNNLGVLYYSTDRYAQATPCFSKAVTLGDKDPTTFGLLGYSLEQERNVVSAEMAYMQALAGAPDNVDWKEGLLRIYIQGRQFGRAESLVKSLIKEQPRTTRFWLAYGNILLAQERRLEAAAVLEAAAGAGVAGPEELALLGDLYAEQKLVPEALAIYARVLVPSPQLGQSKLLHYAAVLIAGGKLDGADQVVRTLQLAKLTPDGQLALMQTKADLLAARQNWVDARAELERLIKLAPMNGRALLSLGRTYAAEENWPRATLVFETAYRIPSATYRASLELANIELKNRHYDRSIEYLEKALSLHKTDGIEDYLARVRTLAASRG
jgi:tetratricopeptide (TPR) repeat protein